MNVAALLLWLLPAVLGEINLLPTKCGQEFDPWFSPWAVSITYHDLLHPDSPKALCSGTLINQRYVLTAAHCVVGVPGRYKIESVLLGKRSTDPGLDCVGEVCSTPMEVKVEEQVYHPMYKGRGGQKAYDIGLLRLEREVELTDSIQPVCLPLDELASINLEGSVATLTLSMSQDGTPEQRTLRREMILVVDLSTCNATYGRNLILTNTQLCAGGRGGEGTCRGDGGTSLVSQLSLPQWGGEKRAVVVGVASFGFIPCAKKGRPDVFTSVGPFVPWLLTQMRE